MDLSADNPNIRPSLSPPTDILMVDDEAAIRELLDSILSRRGYRCDTAGSAEEALKKMERKQYEVVLTDIVMPGMSGVDLLHRIKKKSAETAVIMISALSNLDVTIRSLKLGAYDYITKPFRAEEVLVAIDRALEKRRLLVENLDYQRNLEKKVKEQSKLIQTSFLKTIEALSLSLGAKDQESRIHSIRVTEYAVRIAEMMELNPFEIANIRTAATLHDIGKIGVSEEILDKSDELKDEEIEHIHQHPLVAAQILGPIDELKEIIELIKHHHEWFDGSGYPDGLRKEDIPLGSRIIAVADAFDAMTSARPYRDALSEAYAINEIRDHAGSQFDPAVVAAFMRSLGYEKGGIPDPGKRDVPQLKPIKSRPA